MSSPCQHKWGRWVRSFWYQYRSCTLCKTEQSRVGQMVR